MEGNNRSKRFAQLIGLELKGEFAKHDISQSKVADTLGHSRTSFSKWVNAKPSMPLEAFLNTCELIGVDPREIMDSAYNRLLEEMGPAPQQSPASASADANTGEDLTALAADVVAHLDLYDVAAKRGDIEAEQEAFEEQP